MAESRFDGSPAGRDCPLAVPIGAPTAVAGSHVGCLGPSYGIEEPPPKGRLFC